MTQEEQIFKNGSTTYYFSSKFFPEPTRSDVFKLYSFVRVADDFVDAVPQNSGSFYDLQKQWQNICHKKALTTKDDTIRRVVKNMYSVSKKYHFDQKWVLAFLASMQMDIDKKQYKTTQDTLDYIYGSAEVIGLMMARILGADQSKANAAMVQHYASLQGRSMQYINFIRDIKEDMALGRCYFAQAELKKYGLSGLNTKAIQRNPAAYREFIEAQLAHYGLWQQEANKGFKAVPYRQRIALRTAVDMYNWTAKKIADDPFVVLNKKIKPSKYRVIICAIVRFVCA